MLKVLVPSRPESADNYSSPQPVVSRRFWFVGGHGPPCCYGASVKVMDLFFGVKINITKTPISLAC